MDNLNNKELVVNSLKSLLSDIKKEVPEEMTLSVDCHEIVDMLHAINKNLTDISHKLDMFIDEYDEEMDDPVDCEDCPERDNCDQYAETHGGDEGNEYDTSGYDASEFSKRFVDSLVKAKNDQESSDVGLESLNEAIDSFKKFFDDSDVLKKNEESKPMENFHSADVSYTFELIGNTKDVKTIYSLDATYVHKFVFTDKTTSVDLFLDILKSLSKIIPNDRKYDPEKSTITINSIEIYTNTGSDKPDPFAEKIDIFNEVFNTVSKRIPFTYKLDDVAKL